VIVYFDTGLDVVLIFLQIQNCRRADQRSWPDSGYIYSGYFSSVLDVCLEISMDVRLKSPEVQSSILHTIWLMLKEEVRGRFRAGYQQNLEFTVVTSSIFAIGYL